MFTFFKNLYLSSRLLRDHDLNEMCLGGTVLEEDPRGIKVVQLSNGDILKIFRARHLLSGTRIYSHARRFCRNASRLHHLGVPTVEVKSLYHLEERGHTAVLYAPLAGESIRNLVVQDCNRVQQTAKSFGLFLSELHRKGIHFHSLHTGNILLMPDGQFGLIDISDMTIYQWPLTCHTRLRSFKRLCKYSDDIKALGLPYWQEMLTMYFASSRLRPACQQSLSAFRPF